MQQKSKISDWEEYYQNEDVTKMPWYHDKLDHDYEEVLKSISLDNKTVLDVGTGPATHSIEMAKLGLNVTGTDISETAIAKANKRSESEGVRVDFVQDDILNTKLNKTFDYVFDRGCFHVMPPEKRKLYSDTMYKLIKPGGTLFLKCFSHLETYDDGPYRFTPEQIREVFSENFNIKSIKDSIFISNKDPNPKALFCVIEKR